MRMIILPLCFVLAVLAPALVPAAAAKKHAPESAGRDCSECHASQAQAWESGAHGLMNVKCVVCHGSPEENFSVKPAVNRCRGCHGDMVADVEGKLPAKQRTCFLCHDNHTVAVKEAAAREKSGFHREGGAHK
jgi:hypothetical protein